MVHCSGWSVSTLRQRGCVFFACVFGCIFILGINQKNKKHVKYSNVFSTIKPVPYDPGIPVPEVNGDISEIKCSSSTESEASEKDILKVEQSTNQSKHLTELELNDLTRDSNLTKEFAQRFGSRLRENNLQALSTTYFWYRKRDDEFRKYFN